MRLTVSEDTPAFFRQVAFLNSQHGGRKSYAEARPEVVELAKQLSGQRISNRKISAELASRGYTTATGPTSPQPSKRCCQTEKGNGIRPFT
jgi:hypothetical protein